MSFNLTIREDAKFEQKVPVEYREALEGLLYRLMMQSPILRKIYSR